MKNLENRKVVIIGGSAGIGLATAEMVIEASGTVIIAARGQGRLEAAAATLSNRAGEPVRHNTLAIEDRAAVTAFLNNCAPFDHIVLPGSTVRPILYDALTEEEALASFTSKFWGPFWAAYDARLCMNRGGSVIFFSGVAARKPVKGYIIGAAINGAINALTRSLALEFGKLGLRVNTIAPGPVHTPLWDRLHAEDRDAAFAEFSRRLPVGRVGKAEECALGAIYLMTNEYVTAQVLGIDGGYEVME